MGASTHTFVKVLKGLLRTCMPNQGFALLGRGSAAGGAHRCSSLDSQFGAESCRMCAHDWTSVTPEWEAWEWGLRTES